MSAFVATIPVAVILNSEAGLLGAAVHANQRGVIRSGRIRGFMEET